MHNSPALGLTKLLVLGKSPHAQALLIRKNESGRFESPHFLLREVLQIKGSVAELY
jgi:hypothetical protein